MRCNDLSKKIYIYIDYYIDKKEITLRVTGPISLTYEVRKSVHFNQFHNKYINLFIYISQYRVKLNGEYKIQSLVKETHLGPPVPRKWKLAVQCPIVI